MLHSPLAKLIIGKTGLSVAEFCEKHLGSNYKAFQTRQRKKLYYPAEVIYICWFLGVTCEQAFGHPFSKLVMYQGKYGVPEKIQGLWKDADLREKNRLLALLGLAEIPRHGPAPKIAVEPKKTVTENPVDFLLDLEDEKEGLSPGKEESAPKAADDGLYIETY